MKRGSMTVTLGLVLLVILALFAATLRSVRIAAGRVALASGTEQGLYSLFAEYDRDLFDKYGLLFLDAGYNSNALDLGRLLHTVEETATYSCRPNRDRLFAPGRDVLGVEMTGAAVLGYTLATDVGAAPLRRQACEIMRKNLGTAGMAALKERLEGERLDRDRLLELRADVTEDKAEQYYAEDVAAREDSGAEPPEEVPEDYEDPVAAVDELKKLGILGMTVPKSTATSAGEVKKEELASGRELQQGMGVLKEDAAGIDEKLLMQEYLMQFFPSYRDGDTGGGLCYQVEYAIAGKKSDRENLTTVVRELLLIREASNMLHLMSSAEKRAQADSAAMIASLLLLNPELEPVISFLIKLSWAYAEAIMDVRKLLSGGQIPLWKTEATWQVGLWSVGGALLGFDTADASTVSRGLDYEEYLRLLLLTKSADSLTASVTDLVEMNVRRIDGREGFCLDCCLASIEVELRAEVAGQKMQIARSYSYED